MTKRASSGRERRREEIRDQLLEIVEQILRGGESFTEVSVERLVSEAGMSRSTFYVYFEDKGDLIRAWFGDITAELEDAAANWWELGPDADRDALKTVLDRVVRAYRPHIVLMAATYDAAAYDPAVREQVGRMMRRNVAGLRKHIVAGQDGGFVDPTLLPEQTAEWLTWMAERGLHQLVRNASEAELVRLIEAYTGIVWNTLYAPTRC